MSVNRSRKIKGLGIIFGDRLIFTTNSQSDESFSLKWKQLDPFEEDIYVGFTLQSEGKSIDFFVSSNTVLDEWLCVLERLMILTDVKDDYQFGTELGSGSSGSVYKAWDLRNNKAVAIKVMTKELELSEPRHIRLLKQEIGALRKVDHKYLIGLHGVYEDEEMLCIVTDLLSDGDLLEMVMREGKLSEEDSSKYIRSLLVALEYLHAQNLVHRDVKLENILISKNSDGEPRVVLTDLGLVCACDSEDGCLT
jgi:serine/threonine protein kinase